MEAEASLNDCEEVSELGNDYAAADCAKPRTTEFANLIMSNLDEWAAWYETNS